MSESINLDRALGWTLMASPIDPGLDHGRDLVFARNDNGRDGLALARGPDALAQDLALALTTALGSDLFNLGFGFDGLRAIAEETRRSLIDERVRIAVVQTIRQDPRILRIVDVSVERVPQGSLVERVPMPTLLRVQLTAVVAGGSTLAFDLGVPAF
jgi:phage baseplate assembly protein W